MSDRQGVLLIGGNGFLGRALATTLAQGGREVHILSRHVENGERDGIAFHKGSQDNPSVVLPLLETCSRVVHLASTTTPGSSARDPVIDIEENLLPAARLVDLLSKKPPHRLIFVSSGGSVYGNPRRIPVDESAEVHPLSYHAAAKLALESLFNVFANANGVSLGIARPSNLYGPGQTMRNGFGLVRTLMEKALHQQAAEVWGDGATGGRDYLYIDDAVDACLKLLNDDSATGAYNIGSGTATTPEELVALTAKVTGFDFPVIRRPGRITDVRMIQLDCTRVRDAVGWSASTPLETGLSRTWAWLRSTS